MRYVLFAERIRPYVDYSLETLRGMSIGFQNDVVDEIESLGWLDGWGDGWDSLLPQERLQRAKQFKPDPVELQEQQHEFGVAFDECNIDNQGNDTPIDWNLAVVKLSRLNTNEFARLANGVGPRMDERLVPKRIWNKALDIRRRAEDQGKNDASPADWLQWAKSEGFEVCDGFCKAVESLQEQPNDVNDKVDTDAPKKIPVELRISITLAEPERSPTTPGHASNPAGTMDTQPSIASEQTPAPDLTDTIPEFTGKPMARVGILNEQIPTQKAATLGLVAPVGAPSAPAKAGPVEDGLPTKVIANTFDGMNGWPADRWTKNLSASQWLHTARKARGAVGGASAMWFPLVLAQLIHGKTKGDKAKERIMKGFHNQFNRNPILMPWRDAFNEYFETHCTIN